LKGAGHEATPDLSWRLVLSASRTPRLARTLAPPRRDNSDSDSDAALTCKQATQDHLSYRWPNCATINGLLWCCRLSIYTSAVSDISGKLREPRETQLAAVAAAHGRPTRAHTPDDIDRDSKRAQHHEAIVAWCVAVHVCKSGELQVNSSSRRSGSTSVGFIHGNFALLSARWCVPTSRERTITCERRRWHHLRKETKPTQERQDRYRSRVIGD
jgi:hypothetical protein